jgi:starch phosphorylase
VSATGDPSAQDLVRAGARIAYFSMEIALEDGVPTYAGGLGVLAGDTLRSAADLAVPMVGVTLVHRKGYFRQRLDPEGRQQAEPYEWDPAARCRAAPARCRVTLGGRAVGIAAWVYEVVGLAGASVPVLLLDTDLPENAPEDRRLTDRLYGDDGRTRLAQEVVLGIGGVRMLRALGFRGLERFHMNEGHAALLAVELLREETDRGTPWARAVEAVRRRCVFTTHTPVRAGHDAFAPDLVRAVLDGGALRTLARLDLGGDGLEMTRVALALSGYVNAVSRRHADVTREMFPGRPIDAITNGVHAVTWTAPPFRELYDRAVPGWREDPSRLAAVAELDPGAIAAAHAQAKLRLVQEVNARAHAGFDPDVFTIGFARRFTAYKRPMLLFHDLDRLRAIARARGPLQIVIAGKAHPRDAEGQRLLEQVVAAQRALRPDVSVAVLPNYGLALAGILTAGVDLWLNTPRPPWEASGTSGMKAALNGVPQLSTLDGWWVEGHEEGVTGWAIGGDGGPSEARSDEDDAAELYETLETTILPLYHGARDRWNAVCRSTIARNGARFHTHRMLREYLERAYAAAPVGARR